LPILIASIRMFLPKSVVCTRLDTGKTGALQHT
jgi:hypothetical protein